MNAKKKEMIENGGCLGFWRLISTDRESGILSLSASLSQRENVVSKMERFGGENKRSGGENEDRNGERGRRRRRDLTKKGMTKDYTMLCIVKSNEKMICKDYGNIRVS